MYQFTATTDGTAVTEFDADLTLTFTYTDDQVEGVDESSLVVYYWDSDTSAWVALESVVDADNNTVTANTNHFTDFALMGEEEEAVLSIQPVVKGMTVVVEEDAEEAEITLADVIAGTVDLDSLTTEQLIILIIQILQSQGEDGMDEVPALCSGITFSRSLKQGMSGTDVKCMQAVLNSDSETKLANAGVGSPGNETEYFGSLTKAGVVKFQEKYSNDILAPWNLTTGTGFVGSTTTDKLNELIGQ